MKMEETLSEGIVKEASVTVSARVYESIVPRYEIFLPDQVVTMLGLSEDDTINFIEENGKIYLEKSQGD